MTASPEQPSLRTKSLTATAWSGTELLLRQGIQFVVSIALARLLTPADFGTVALLYLFVGIASLFIDTGFSAALVQRSTITTVEESSVFWFNVGAGALVAIGLCAASPVIAAFYGMPVLVPLTCIMAVNLFITALSSVHLTLLTRSLDFKTQAKISFVASAISGGAAVLAAWRGAGLWALALQVLLSSVVTSVLVWNLHKWQPAFRFSLASLRSLFRFSGYLFLYFSLDTIYSRFYTLIIGKLYSPSELGLYSRADGTQRMPTGLMTAIIHRASFPVFSAAAQDKELLRRGLRKAMLLSMWLNVPAMLGIVVTAKPLVLTLFGDPWLGSVAPLRVLCLGGILQPMQSLNSSVLMAQGRSKLLLHAEVILRLFGVLALITTSFFGVMAIAWSMVAYAVAGYLLKARYSGELLGYSTIQQLRDVAPIGVAAGCIALMVFLVPRVTSFPVAGLLAAQVTLGIVAYVGFSWIFQLEAFTEARSAGMELVTRSLGKVGRF
jgi:O-antigen/teichoic acid export membrane protein